MKNGFNNARYEYFRVDKRCMVITPLILLLAGIFTRFASGNPIESVHYLGIREIIPPIWLMVLLFSISYVVGGVSLGSALGNNICIYNDKKYQGAMWFCICFALGYAWYPIFFCAKLYLASVIVSLLAAFCALCATICFTRVSRISFASAVLYDLWLLYLTFLNFQVFFLT